VEEKSPQALSDTRRVVDRPKIPETRTHALCASCIHSDYLPKTGRRSTRAKRSAISTTTTSRTADRINKRLTKDEARRMGSASAVWRRGWWREWPSAKIIYQVAQ
jgi:hypothetical protein